MGIYPEKRTPYETAFILLGEPPLAVKTPPWAIRLVLEAPDLDRTAEQLAEEIDLDELPEL